MMVMRNCAKIFFLNEIEACQVLMLIKNIGWQPSQIILQNMDTFKPPSCFLEDLLNEKQLEANPILVHIMILCYTAKKLMNDHHVTLVIQHFIEVRCFEQFGSLFNQWIKRNEAYCVINIKKINKLYSTILREPKTYSFNEHNQLVPQQYLELPIAPKELLQSAEHSVRITHTRKSSINSYDLSSYLDLPEPLLLSSKII